MTDDLQRRAEELREASFRLALAVHRGGERTPAEERARQIDDELFQVQQDPQLAALADQEPVLRAITDARLDLGYVLSRGEDPTMSTRLYHALDDR